MSFPSLKSLIAAAALSSAALVPFTVHAQALELPRPSPVAKVTQTVGVTEVSVSYSSPGVKGRKIWGELVPFGQIWRTGANEATQITFSKDVTFGGQAIPAGTYSLHTIPADGAEWTVIVNKNPKASQWDYKQEEDQARFTAKPTEAPMRERLAFIFSNMTDDAATLDLEWEKLRLSLPIQTNTSALAAANIDAASEAAARTTLQAARYHLEKNELDKALQFAETSLALKDAWFPAWVKSQILAKKGDAKGAYAEAQHAYDLGMKDKMFFFKAEVEKYLADNKAMDKKGAKKGK